jgi:hypothetical protein
MARYRVLRQSYLGGRIYEAGEKVEFDGWPSDNLEPLDAAARQTQEAAEKHFAEERRAQTLANNPVAVAMAEAIEDRREKGRSREAELHAKGAPLYDETEDKATTTKGARKS